MSTAFPNEPTGSNLINDQPHNAIVGNGWTDVYDTAGWQTTIVSDATAPLSPTNVLRQRFPQGLVGGNGGGGGNFYSFGASYDQCFWGFWIKTDANWEQHPVLTKIAWMHTTLAGNPHMNQLFLGLAGNNPYYINANYQQTNIDNSHMFGGGPVGTIRMDPTVNSTFAAAQWAKVEWYFKQSTTNTSRNGICKVWVNNVLTINVTNMNTDRITVDSVSHITVWGGTGSVKSRESYLYFDHSYISSAQGVPSGGGDPPPLVAPTNLSPGNVTIPYGSTTFSWNAVPGASSYAVRIHKVGNPYEPTSELLAYVTQSGTSITKTTEPSAQYDWWVHAVDGAGALGPSSGALLTTSASPVPPPPDPDPTPDPPPDPPVTPDPIDPPPVITPPPPDPPAELPEPAVLGTVTITRVVKDRQNPVIKEYRFYGR